MSRPVVRAPRQEQPIGKGTWIKTDSHESRKTITLRHSSDIRPEETVHLAVKTEAAAPPGQA
jgi:hypothetical protein